MVLLERIAGTFTSMQRPSPEKAIYLLTNNRPEDFSAAPAEEHYEIYNSDDFFNLVADSNVQAFIAATEAQF